MNKHRIASFTAAALAALALVSGGVSAAAENKPAPAASGAAVSCIGSVSKMYVTTAVMQLADKGLVDIDKPVTAYLPEFRMQDARYQKITVRMLMNHTSGLMGTTAGDFMLLNDRDTAAHDLLLRELRTQRLKTDPGDYGAYCNDGFTVLELLVERVSGESFTAYLQHHISQPLGLKRTGTPWDLFRAEDQVDTFRNRVRYQPDYCMAIGSGGIISAAEDVCNFGSAFFRGDSRLLSEDAKNEMFRTDVTDPYEDAFGLGWDTVEDADYKAAGVKVVSKGGDVMLQHASMMVAPEAEISVAVLSSGGSSMNDQLMASALLDIALEEQGIHVEHPQAEEKETLSAVPERYLPLAGSYLGSEAVYTLTFPEGKYMELTAISEDKQEVTRYFYTTEDSFVQMEGNLRNGKAVQAKNQNVLHFTRRKGRDYLLSDSFYEIGLKGRLHDSSYYLMRLPEHTVSDAAQAAWDARSGKKYYFCNGKYSNAYYAELPAISLKTYPEIRGYAGVCRIVDETHAEGALVMPGGRDLTDLTVRTENGIEYLDRSNEAVTYMAEDAIPELKSDLREVPLHTKQASWYRIGSSDNQTIHLDIPEHAAVYVYDAYDHMTYTSAMPDYGNSVPLPAGGKIVFLGEDGECIRLTQ